MSQESKAKLTIFQRLEKFGDLFFINILFVISCIPVITIGAAFVAMYTFLLKLVEDEEGPVWKSYWKAFKENFKQATQVWLILLAIFGIMFLEFLLSYYFEGIGLALILGIIAIEAVFLSFILPVLFPLIARYENTTKNMFKNAFLISVTNLGSWFYMFFIWVLPIALYAASKKVLYYTWVAWLVILIGVFAYATSIVAIKLFAKIENDEKNRENESSDDDIDDDEETDDDIDDEEDKDDIEAEDTEEAEDDIEAEDTEEAEDGIEAEEDTE